MNTYLVPTLLILLSACIIGCQPKTTETDTQQVQVVGAMRKTVWEGELEAKVLLDSLAGTKGLYGLGPLAYLRGELLLMDGRSYASRVQSDTTMTVEETATAGAPFFVYAQVQEWEELPLPDSLHSISDIENFIQTTAGNKDKPFAFRLVGRIDSAHIHIQQLPEGATVSSPEEAHQGQVSYALGQEEVEIIGFYSTRHKGIFTHHDSYLHMHLITADKQKMGHLDDVHLATMTLYLPKER